GNNAVAGRRDGLPAPTFAGRVRPSRQPHLDFTAVPADDPPPPAAAPPEPVSDGTLISRPDRASGNPAPPEGLPQISACSSEEGASGRAADSLACRQALETGPLTPGKGGR